MFGTSGIRGVYGSEITEALAYRVGNIFADKALAVGRDIRKSGISLKEALVRGSNDAGADVIDLGIAPTPSVAFATRDLAARAVMLTASHNPEEFNGLKLIEAQKEIGKAMEKQIERDYKAEKVVVGANRGSLFADQTVIDGHKEMVKSLVDIDSIAKRKPKIIVDCNGAASVITPQLLTDLGCVVISTNSSMEGFNRPSEPNAKNLAYLSSLVPEIGADFAIAHDGDGDRCVVVDETGAVLPFDAQLALMIEHEIERSKNKKNRIISTVEASLVIREVVEKAGAQIDITPVGSTFIGDLMEENGALFGGEPCGEYVYRDGVHVPDAVLAAAKFAEIFCQRGAFSKLKTRYRQFPIAREKFAAKDKRASMIAIADSIGSLAIDGTIRSDDGIRIDEEDGWFLVRASGTEPIVRLTMEYRSQERLDQRKKQVGSLILSKL
jgi:phosphoglucosamine mutase